MTLIIILDVIVICILVGIASVKGLERALPFVTFVMVLFPRESQLPLGFLGLTTQRVVLITLTILYFCFALAGNSRSEPRRSFKDPLKWLMLLGIVWSVISTANSIVPAMSIKKMISQVIEYYWLYYIYTRVIRDTKTIQRILYAIVVAVSVCSMLGMVEIFSHWNVTHLFPYMATLFGHAGDITDSVAVGRGYRIRTTFPHPILYGGALAMAIVIGLYLAREARGTRRIMLWSGLLLMFYNIYKTASRGPWLALVLGLGLLFLLGEARLRKYMLVLGMLVLAVLVTRPGVLSTLVGIYRSTSNPTTIMGSSYDYRYALAHVALGAVTQSVPRAAWGYGMESFYYLHLEGLLEGRPYPFLSCDSAWVDFVVESGFVGLVLIAMLLWKAAFIAWRNYKRSPKPDRYLPLVLLANMMMYYFMMISVDMYSYGQNGYILWLLIAVSISYGHLKLSPESAAECSRVGGSVIASRTAGRLQPAFKVRANSFRRVNEP